MTDELVETLREIIDRLQTQLLRLEGAQLDRAYVDRWVDSLGLQGMWSRVVE